MSGIEVFALVGSSIALLDQFIRAGRNARKGIAELDRQVSEYEVILRVAEEAFHGVSKYEKVPKSMQGAMLLCAQRHEEFYDLISRDQKAYRVKHPEIRRFRMAAVSMRRTKRRMAFEAFRDSVLLLRDLSQQTEVAEQLETEVNSDDIQHWNPEDFEEETGVHLEDFRSSTVKVPVDSKTLGLGPISARSHYGYDVTIAFQTGSGIKYIPARALKDTGSEEFFISKSLLQRDEIPSSEFQNVENKVLNGIGGATFRPSQSISLTWYVNRNYNTLRTEFFVDDNTDTEFDIILPWDFRIGSRTSGRGDTASRALILQMRKKSTGELEF
ncbi:hypothetical protein P152DRAFT_327482 [Eremomyces bilateralis CBS 781.70]|uniref:Peptidase A2 domain-containing protein n=1 Tax=Eremomyces bilateralis CBS 781.70 TaxID=1392243 RepID=A0A6G1G4F6_9PEZI|nr:uncharacterized protein P152DRAFT_327482 [Eremomyces bilateralis CBS 781.70]KAF1812831.1 hypothetical protein P152DRAFT_327482 [Eremomyces bilateralis CBS 781.70]